MPTRSRTPLAKLPPLAEPKTGDRIASHFDGRVRIGRVRERYLSVWHVEFEDEPGKTHAVSSGELWKVREKTHADPR